MSVGQINQLRLQLPGRLARAFMWLCPSCH